jgi:hypothetical protein
MVDKDVKIDAVCNAIQKYVDESIAYWTDGDRLSDYRYENLRELKESLQELFSDVS